MLCAMDIRGGKDAINKFKGNRLRAPFDVCEYGMRVLCVIVCVFS